MYGLKPVPFTLKWAPFKAGALTRAFDWNTTHSERHSSVDLRLREIYPCCSDLVIEAPAPGAGSQFFLNRLLGLRGETYMALQSAASAHGAAGSEQPIAAQQIPVVLNGRSLESNRGIPLNLDWVEKVRVNTSAVERRVATHRTRRTVKKKIRQRGCCAPSPAWT
jgi:hypothetical protein